MVYQSAMSHLAAWSYTAAGVAGKGIVGCGGTSCTVRTRTAHGSTSRVHSWKLVLVPLPDLTRPGFVWFHWMHSIIYVAFTMFSQSYSAVIDLQSTKKNSMQRPNHSCMHCLSGRNGIQRWWQRHSALNYPIYLNGHDSVPELQLGYISSQSFFHGGWWNMIKDGALARWVRVRWEHRNSHTLQVLLNQTRSQINSSVLEA